MTWESCLNSNIFNKKTKGDEGVRPEKRSSKSLTKENKIYDEARTEGPSTEFPEMVKHYQLKDT